GGRGGGGGLCSGWAGAGGGGVGAWLGRYPPQLLIAGVVAHDAVRLDFSLAAGRVEATPLPLSARVDPGEIAARMLSLANTGGAGAAFHLLELAIAPASQGARGAMADPAKRRAAAGRRGPRG